MKKTYYAEIHIARGMGVLIVLLGHSFPDAEIGVFAHPVFRWGYDTCYSFHMALFFVISGFVIGAKFYDGDYSLGKEVIAKVKRLIVPYLFLSYLSLLPKIFLNAYARNPVDTRSALLVLFGQSPNGSLWYLYTLFIFSLFALCCGKIFRSLTGIFKNVWMILCGILSYGLVIYAGETALHVLFIDKICRYLLFYVGGIIVYRYYSTIKRIYSLPFALLSLAVMILLVCPYISLRTDYCITAILGSYGILVLADRMTLQKNSKTYVFFDKCGVYSFDLYILSYYVQQAIRVICFRKLEWNYTIVFILELLLGFSISYLFSVYILRKNRLLKKVLIGTWED